MTTFIFVVSKYFINGDGYTSRVLMETQLLSSHYNVIILMPDIPNDIDIPQNISIDTYKVYGRDKFFLWFNLNSLRARLKELLDRYRDAIVCGESLIPSLQTYKVAKTSGNKFVFDCHGIEPAEFALNHPGILGKVISKILEIKEKQVLKNTNLVITVTKQQYKQWNTNTPNIVFPMLPSKQFLSASKSRNKIRDILGIPSDACVYLYSGQNQKWQMCDETIKYFSDFLNKENNWLVIYTGQIEFFKDLISKYDIQNFVVTKIKYSEMPDYLSACDYGFCIRNSSIINKVASPTKVLEYVSQNVTPILTPFVGDFSRNLCDLGLAVCVDDLQHGINEKIKIIGLSGTLYVNSLVKEKVNQYINSINELNGNE